MVKYLSQLSDDEVVELIKPLAFGKFVELDFLKRYGSHLEVCIISECEHEDEEEKYTITLDDLYYLNDYSVKTYDYQRSDEKEIIREYRHKLFRRFGDEYARDFLLQ